MTTKIDIREVKEGSDLNAVRALCRSFRTWLYERYPDDREALEVYYRPKAYEDLMARLGELHAPPEGTIFLATVDGSPGGCVMLSKLEDGVCEMKRLFVSHEFRGHGLGRRLCQALLNTAAALGYRCMRLDTGPLHHEAQALYGGLGFTVRSAYYDPGPELRDRMVYMERDLTDL
jgi:GNAT superfamily N-acetyltransferase